ncbi:MAG: glycosyltransferase family 4 protein [Acidimicrobiales bacterium]
MIAARRLHPAGHDGPVAAVADGADPALLSTPLSPRPLADIAAEAGLERIHILAWRDLLDDEAGGSEVHAARVAAAWADAGLDVTMRTSSAAGHPAYSFRDGYRVIRKSGRYAVFPRAALSGLLGRTGPRDGLVEVWNGMPFFSPLWARSPRVVVLHHVHAEMWRMVIKPAALARVGELIEFRIAPPVYRRSRIITLSESSREEIVDLLGMRPDRIDVIPPGVDDKFSPGVVRSPAPLVVAVGRLVPVKRFDRLVDSLVALRRSHPTLEAVIVGEGYERPALEARIRAAGPGGWLRLPGRLSDDELIDLYRRAWVLASASAREGWGMTITEAGACGTPAVVTDIAGHRDAIVDGVSGVVTDDLEGELDRIVRDAGWRQTLGAGAEKRAAALRWDATARRTLEALAAEALARRLRAGSR